MDNITLVNKTIMDGDYLPKSGGTLTGSLSGVTAIFSGAVKSHNKNVMEVSSLIEATRSTLAALITDITGAMALYEITFTAAESPDGSANSVWTGTLIKQYTDFFTLQVHRTIMQDDTTTIPTAFFCACNLVGSSMRWTDWQQVITSVGGTITGTLKLSTSTAECITRTDDAGALAIQGGSQDSRGARLSLSGKDRTGGYAGMFTLRAYDGSNDRTLTGKPNGTLTWGSNDISGNITTVSTSPMSGISVHCYKIGRLVIVHGDGYNSTAMSANQTIIGNLPKPSYNRVPVTLGYYNTFNRGTRLVLVQDGSYGKLVADTEGLAADYFKFNFTYISES